MPGPRSLIQPCPNRSKISFFWKSVSSPDTVAYFEEQWNNCSSIRYGDLKKQLAADIIAFTTPIRERYLDICNNDEYLHKK